MTFGNMTETKNGLTWKWLTGILFTVIFAGTGIIFTMRMRQVEALDIKVAQSEDKIGKSNERVSSLEARVDGIDARLQRIEQKIDLLLSKQK